MPPYKKKKIKSKDLGDQRMGIKEKIPANKTPSSSNNPIDAFNPPPVKRSLKNNKISEFEREISKEVTSPSNFGKIEKKKIISRSRSLPKKGISKKKGESTYIPGNLGLIKSKQKQKNISLPKQDYKDEIKKNKTIPGTLGKNISKKGLNVKLPEKNIKTDHDSSINKKSIPTRFSKKKGKNKILSFQRKESDKKVENKEPPQTMQDKIPKLKIKSKGPK